VTKKVASIVEMGTTAARRAGVAPRRSGAASGINKKLVDRAEAVRGKLTSGERKTGGSTLSETSLPAEVPRSLPVTGAVGGKWPTASSSLAKRLAIVHTTTTLVSPPEMLTMFRKKQRDGLLGAKFASKQIYFSLGDARAKLKDYLKNINSVSREQLIKDLNSIGLKYIGGSGDGKYCKFKHPERGFSVRIDDIHPSKRNNGCKYQHIHLFDKHGRSLNADLKTASPSSPDAHIKINELLKVLELKP
jgi:hypothetical protein